MTPSLKALWYFLAFLVLVVLQTTFCRLISVGGIQPDLLLIFIIFVSMKEGPTAGVWTGFLAGLLFDVYSPQNLGSGSLAKSIIGLATGLLDERTIKIDDRLRLLIMFTAALLHGLILHASVYPVASAFTVAFLPQILPGALYTTLVGGIVVFIDSRRE
ncbi:MAG: rod shape-determining protein MreD [Fibrobacterota bacterium]